MVIVLCIYVEAVVKKELCRLSIAVLTCDMQQRFPRRPSDPSKA